jgi:DNA-binding NarL/FixJ family response regulator
MIRVIIADDHAIFRQGLTELLGGNDDIGLVGTARNGDEAVELCASLGPDVLILDLSMPGIDGFEVVRRLRASGAAPRILVLSMHKDPGSIRRALDLGVDGYILKDDAFDELARAVLSVARGGRFLSPPVRAAVNRSGGGEGKEALTPREREVVIQIAAGRSTREIAERLGIGVKTVETHRQHVMEKLGFRKTAQIAVYAIKEGLVE